MSVVLAGMGCRSLGKVPDPSLADQTVGVLGQGPRPRGSVAAYEHYTRSEILYEKGDLTNAVRELEIARAFDSRNGYLAARLAVMLIEQKKRSKARRLISKVLGRDPMNGLAWLALAMWHRQVDAEEKASASAKRAIRVDPSSVDAALWLADYKRSLGRNAYAREVLSQAVARQPQNAAVHLALGRLYLDLGHYSNARRHFSTFVSLKSHRLDVIVELAEAHEKSGDSAGAADFYEMALAGDPTNAQLRLTLIALLFERNELVRAERHIHSLPPVDPEDTKGALQRARFLAKVGDLYAARAMLATQLETDPLDTELILSLASVEISLGRLEAAAILLKEPDIDWSEQEMPCKEALIQSLHTWPETYPTCGAINDAMAFADKQKTKQ